MSIKQNISELDAELRKAIGSTGFSKRTDIPQLTLSTESMDEAARTVAVAGTQELSDVVSNALDHVLSRESSGVSLSHAQRQAATSIAAFAIDPKIGFNSLANPKLPSSDTDAAVISPVEMGIFDSVDFGALSTESFDSQSLDNALYLSIAGNAFGPKQDEFSETHFPTIAIAPDVSGITIGTEIVSLYKNFSRIDGGTVRNKFDKVTLAKAIYNNDLLGGDRNKLVPVVTAANEQYLIPSLSHIDTSTGSEITTAPIAIGKPVNIPGISQTEAMLANGAMDAYDTLDRSVRLTNIVLTLTGTDGSGTAVTEDFLVPVGMLPYSNFTHTAQGHDKDLNLFFETSDVMLMTSTSKAWTGTELVNSVILAGLPAGYGVKLHLKITGDGNVQYGDISVYATLSEIASVVDSSGAVVPTTAADYNTIKDVFNTLTVVGYELEAYLTNSNLRKEGDLITVDKFEQIYTVPVRSGISVVMGIKSNNNDDSRLVGQVQTIGYKMNLNAVETLVAHTDNLLALTNNGANTDIGLMGVGRRHVDAYGKELTIDLPTLVDSESSSERADDIRAALWAQVKNAISLAYIDSKYNIAHEQLHGSDSPVGVILGTSSYLKNYLLADNNSVVDLGNGFLVKVVSTPNPRISNQMYITFSDHMSSTRNTTVDAISFGQCVWAPTITTDVATTVNGAVTRKFQTHPRYLHIVNLPIMIRMNVTGVDSVIGKVALNTKSI